MTLKEYINNPAGKGDSSLNRAATITMLDSKYEKLIKEKSIKVRTYRKLGGRDEYYIHLVIPTETNRDNTYDVAFYFYNDPEKPVSDIKNYHVQCFANTPSFAYTFLNVYYKEGLFIECLMDKFDDVFFKGEPEVRNKYKIVNYDKYLYFGAKYILESHLLNKAILEVRSINYTELIFKKHIRTFSKIMSEYRKANNALKDGKTKKNDKDTKRDNSKRRTVNSNGVVQPVAKKTSSVKTKKPVKKSVKKINKIQKR